MRESLLGLHVMPWHNSTEIDKTLARFKPNWVKVVRPEGDKMPDVDVAMRHAQHVLIRSWLISENWGNRAGIATPEDAIAVGDKIAAAYKGILQWMRSEFGYSNTEMEKVVVEVALNEPKFWTNEERPEMAALCTQTAVENMTASGVRVAALNAGVSWAGNNDTPEHPHPGAIPDWSPFLNLFKAIERNNGWLSVHEYCDCLEHGGQYGYKFNWGWWGGHVYSLLPYFAAAGVKIPILITEAGIDNLVNDSIPPSVPRGWYSLVNSGNDLASAATRYMDILGWYDQQLLQFPGNLIDAIMIYTYDYQSKDWETFDVRAEEFLKRLEGHIGWIRNENNELEPPVVPVYDTDVPWYPDAIQPPIEPPPIEPPVEPPIEPEPPGEYPSYNETVAARWASEQATREIESILAAIEKLDVELEKLKHGLWQVAETSLQARSRLTDKTTPTLYKFEAAVKDDNDGV